MSTRTEEDLIDNLFVASTHAYILVFTTKGKLHWLKVWRIPEVATTGKGKPIINMIQIDKDDRVAGIIAVHDFDTSEHVVMASRMGYIKKTPLSAFSRPRSNGIIACTVGDDDELMSVMLDRDDQDIVLFSLMGKAIRFTGNQVRSMGRVARGVRGIRLKKKDELIGMATVDLEKIQLLTVTRKGYGKRTPVSEYRAQGRGGQGVININTSERNGNVVKSLLVSDDSEIIIITESGKIIRMGVDQIRLVQSRNSLGVKLIDLEDSDRVADVSVLELEEEPSGEIAEDEA